MREMKRVYSQFLTNFNSAKLNLNSLNTIKANLGKDYLSFSKNFTPKELSPTE